MPKRITFRGQISPIISAIRMGGDSMRISFDIPLIERDNAIPLLALTDQPLVLTIEVDTNPVATRIQRPENGDRLKKEKPVREPGPYAFFWQRMHAKGFDTFPDLQEVLQCEVKDVHQKLREFFETDHLSAAVGPHEFRQFVKDHQMSEGLITLTNQAEVWAMEKAGEIERV